MIKIKEYKARKYGLRGVEMSIPKVFLEDNNIKDGDKLEIYREFIDGKDALIILPKRRLSKKNES